MRTLLIAAGAMALATAAEAQPGPRGGVAGAPRPGGWHGTGKPGGWNGGVVRRGGWSGTHIGRPVVNHPRWGGRIQGRWWGGMRAPGGWGAYRRPVRGWVLPSYWVQPNWYVTNWSAYGLAQPPYGYNWSRYYDDAVLIDGRGTVYDSVDGIGWDQVDEAGYAYGDDYADGYDGAYDNGYAPAPQLPYPAPDADGGLGGAIIGGVVGGVAGNVIAGRGNRLGGTLIGAGAGALVGQAIDKSDSAGNAYTRERYGAPYPAPGHAPAPYAGQVVQGQVVQGQVVQGHGAPQVAYQTGSYGGDYAGTTYSGVTYYGAAPPVAPQPLPGRHPRLPYGAPYPGAASTSVTNGSAVTTTSVGGGYIAGGFYYPPATITTVTVSHAGAGGYEEVYESDAYYATGKGRRYTKGGCNC